MKYVAILRTSRNDGGWHSFPLTHVEKSDFFDKKSDAKKWLEQAITEFQQKADNDESIAYYCIHCKTIIAFSEKESSEFKEFLDQTSY